MRSYPARDVRSHADNTTDNPWDPWGATHHATPTTPQLGWRGELHIDGLTWLRNRAYDPTTRAFLTPDPLPPVPGTPTVANPYHYANNDPINQLDPWACDPSPTPTWPPTAKPTAKAGSNKPATGPATT